MDGTPFAGSQLDDWAGMLMIPGLMRGLSLTCLSLSNNDQLGPNITITTSYYPVPAISNECNMYLNYQDDAIIALQLNTKFTKPQPMQIFMVLMKFVRCLM